MFIGELGLRLRGPLIRRIGISAESFSVHLVVTTKVSLLPLLGLEFCKTISQLLCPVKKSPKGFSASKCDVRNRIFLPIIFYFYVSFYFFISYFIYYILSFIFFFTFFNFFYLFYLFIFFIFYLLYFFHKLFSIFSRN